MTVSGADSSNYDLANCFVTIKKQIFIENFNDKPINITRGVVYEQNSVLTINHEDNTLIKLRLDNNKLEKVRIKEISSKLPYTMRSNFKSNSLLVSFKGESVIVKHKLLNDKHKELTFKTNQNENFTRIWDILIDDLTEFTYVLDISLKTIYVYNEKHKFHKEITLLGKEKFWPRDMRIFKKSLYVVDTCTCLYDFDRSKLISFTDGGNCIRVFETNKFRMVKCIKHANMIRPLGMVLDKNENIFTTANFMNNYKFISPSQYLFGFNKAGKILNVTCLNVDLRAKGISDIIFVNAEKLVFTALSAGYIICDFEKKKVKSG